MFPQDPLLHSLKAGEGGKHICMKNKYSVRYLHFLTWKNLPAFSLPPWLWLCSDNSIVRFLVGFTRIWGITQHLHDSWGVQHAASLLWAAVYCSLLTDAKLRCKGIKRGKKIPLFLHIFKIITFHAKLQQGLEKWAFDVQWQKAQHLNSLWPQQLETCQNLWHHSEAGHQMHEGPASVGTEVRTEVLAYSQFGCQA